MKDGDRDRQLIEAMCAMENTAGYDKFLEYLRDELAKIKNALVMCPDDYRLHLMQGQAQALQGIVNQAATARVDLQKIQANDERRRRATALKPNGIPPETTVRN